MDVDLPEGQVVRIRRVDELKYPINNDDYVFKMLSLLRLAISGKIIVDDTYAQFCKTRVHASIASDSILVLLSLFSTNTQSPSTCGRSSSSKKSRKHIY